MALRWQFSGIWLAVAPGRICEQAAYPEQLCKMRTAPSTNNYYCYTGLRSCLPACDNDFRQIANCPWLVSKRFLQPLNKLLGGRLAEQSMVIRQHVRVECPAQRCFSMILAGGTLPCSRLTTTSLHNILDLGLAFRPAKMSSGSGCASYCRLPIEVVSMGILEPGWARSLPL